MKKIKVGFAIPTLDSLGAQRVLITILKNINQSKFDIFLIVNEVTGDFKNEIPNFIKIIEVKQKILNIPMLRVLEYLFYGYYRAIKKENLEVIISIVPFTNFALFITKKLYLQKFKLIVSEHAHVTGAMLDSENMGNAFQKIYKKYFKTVYNSKTVDNIITIAEESREDLIINHQIKRNKTTLINNPNDYQNIQTKSKENITDKTFSKWKENNNVIFISSGRLVHQKRHDILINSFSVLASKYPNCRLIIMGSGSKKQLTDLIADNEIKEKVYLAGFKSNPWKYIYKSDFFVLSSIWEGLPCVLTETLILKTPIISSDCPSGPKEILKNGEFGNLYNYLSVDELTKALFFAYENSNKLKEKAEKGYQSIYRYDPKFITNKYENLIEKTCINNTHVNHK